MPPRRPTKKVNGKATTARPAARLTERKATKPERAPVLSTLPEPTIVAITSLQPHPRNYRTRTPEQLEHLTQSIRTHGLYRNIVVARDGTILAGHGVVEAAKVLHMTEVPVIRLDLAADDPRAIKVLIGDNQIAQLAEVNDRLLTDMLQEINTSDLVDLLGTGYNEEQLALLLMVTRPSSEIADQDEAAEWVGLPAFDNDLPIVAMIYCKSEADRDAFFAAIGAGEEHITRNTRGASVRWPLELKRVKATAVFVEEGQPHAGQPLSDLHPKQGTRKPVHHGPTARPRSDTVPSGRRAAGGRGVSKRLRQ